MCKYIYESVDREMGIIKDVQPFEKCMNIIKNSIPKFGSQRASGLLNSETQRQKTTLRSVVINC